MNTPELRWLLPAVGAMLAAWAALATPGCDDGQRSRQSLPPATVVHDEPAAAPTIDLPAADQRLCTGIVVLIDTSGSMAGTIGGRPKADIARDALRRIMRYTDEWKQKHPDRPLQIALYSFSSSPSEVLAMGDFNAIKAEAAVARIPKAAGGTAIGAAVIKGFEALYRSGCTRKHVVCITDGENTAGPKPEHVTQQLYNQTQGEVELHFVAFDVSSSSFAFLERVNGHVLEAADGEQLEGRLSEIYEKRILAETMPVE